MFHKILVLCQGKVKHYNYILYATHKQVVVFIYLQVVYSGVPEKAYKVFLKAQTKRNRKPDDFNTKNPAGTATKLFFIAMTFLILDAIMDMLNSENWRQAILQQCSQDRHTQVEVKRALSNTNSYDGHTNTQ